MKRVFLVATAVLLVTAAAVTGRVIAKGSDTPNQQNQPTTTPGPTSVPPFLMPILTEGIPPHTPALIIDFPARGTIYPPEIIPPQFAWRDDWNRAKRPPAKSGCAADFDGARSCARK